MPRFPPFPSPKPRQNAALIYVPSHLTFVVRVDYEISTHQECLHVLLLVGHGELLHLYCISLFGDFLIWEKCITFYSRQKKIKQLLFILGSALDLRSLETHQKGLWMSCAAATSARINQYHHISRPRQQLCHLYGRFLIWICECVVCVKINKFQNWWCFALIHQLSH